MRSSPVKGEGFLFAIAGTAYSAARFLHFCGHPGRGVPTFCGEICENIC